MRALANSNRLQRALQYLYKRSVVPGVAPGLALPLQPVVLGQEPAAGGVCKSSTNSHCHGGTEGAGPGANTHYGAAAHSLASDSRRRFSQVRSSALP